MDGVSESEGILPPPKSSSLTVTEASGRTPPEVDATPVLVAGPAGVTQLVPSGPEKVSRTAFRGSANYGQSRLEPEGAISRRRVLHDPARAADGLEAVAVAVLNAAAVEHDT